MIAVVRAAFSLPNDPALSLPGRPEIAASRLLGRPAPFMFA